MRHSYSDKTISQEKIYEINILQERARRKGGVNCSLSSPWCMVPPEIEKCESILIRGNENIRLSENDKQNIVIVIQRASHLREITFDNISVKDFNWIPCKEKITNVEFRNAYSKVIIDFKGIENFTNLKRILFYGFFDKSKNFDCFAKLTQPLSIFSAHSWFGENIEVFGRLRLEELVVTELFMQEMCKISKLDYPETLKVLEFYGTGEINLPLGELKNLQIFAFGRSGRGIRKKINGSVLKSLKKLKELYISEEAVDDISCLEELPFFEKIN